MEYLDFYSLAYSQRSHMNWKFICFHNLENYFSLTRNKNNVDFKVLRNIGKLLFLVIRIMYF